MKSFIWMISVLQGFLLAYDLLSRPFYILLSYLVSYLSSFSSSSSSYSKSNTNTKVRKSTNILRASRSELLLESPARASQLKHESWETMVDAWNWAIQTYGHAPVFGSREILGTEKESQGNGKVFTKILGGDYLWISYLEADERISWIRRGLLELGLYSGDKIAIYADTRVEWLLIALACLQSKIIIVTLYTNLGYEAIAHGINLCDVTHVVTSHELLPKFRNILLSTPSITRIIFFENPLESTDLIGFCEDVYFISFSTLLVLGQDASSKFTEDSGAESDKPNRDDTAIIMFTSGSTGVPKGVLLSHRNLISTLESLSSSLPFDVGVQDTYLAYLPLAHVLELLSEMTALLFGIKIGYSHPNTLTDKSSMIKEGKVGDATLLQPTLFPAVPLVLDRITKSIARHVDKRGILFSSVFEILTDYKLKALRRGDSTPLLDLFVFSRLRRLLGGRLRIIFSGGAPLCANTHDFIRVVFGAPVLQGYGLTETTVSACIMDIHDTSTGSVGFPNTNVQLKLVNWDEGHYRVTDTPRPRGEIHLGGDFVSKGYFKMSEKTKDDFYEENGRRWFRTGDIGEYLENGSIKIVDRKKDLVKLQLGEYVSLGKVESILKSCPLVENLCVYGDPSKTYCVALVVPSRPILDALAEKHRKTHLTFDQITEDSLINEVSLKMLTAHGMRMKLEKFEIPKAVTLCKELWDPETGLVTAAFKLKRKPIQDYYQTDLDRMYSVSRSL